MAVISFGIKAAGPAMLGARPLPDRVRAVIALLAPVLLFALVTTELLGSRWSAVDARVVIGVAAAAAARLGESRPSAPTVSSARTSWKPAR